jgi:hypothetical protein
MTVRRQVYRRQLNSTSGVDGTDRSELRDSA